MKKPTEKHIETYIVYPADLTGEEMEWIQQWVEKDAELRMLADWYRGYYKNVDQIETSRENASADRPTQIKLKPFERRSQFSNGVFVLAAQTPITERKKPNLDTIRTFVSEEYKTLIRVLHDSTKNHSKLHVISEFVDEDDIVLVEIFDENSTLMVSEPGGTLVIPDEKIPANTIRDWSQCELHIPVSKISVYKDDVTGHFNFDLFESHQPRENIDLSIEEETLNISVEEMDHFSPRKLVLHSGNHSNFWPMENGHCSIPVESFTDSESFLYFFN